MAEVLTALVAGQIDVALSAIPPALSYLRSGLIKAIAIGGPKRFPLLPDVPTFAEGGVPNVESRSWFGFVVPAGTPYPDLRVASRRNVTAAELSFPLGLTAKARPRPRLLSCRLIDSLDPGSDPSLSPRAIA